MLPDREMPPECSSVRTSRTSPHGGTGAGPTPRCLECLQGAVTQTAGRAPRPHLQGCRGAREACRGHAIIKITNAEGAPSQESVSPGATARPPALRAAGGYIYNREHASTRGGAVTSVSVGESNWGDCGHNTEQPVSPRPWWLPVGRHAGTDTHVMGTGTHPGAPRPSFWRNMVKG